MHRLTAASTATATALLLLTACASQGARPAAWASPSPGSALLPEDRRTLRCTASPTTPPCTEEVPRTALRRPVLDAG